MIKKEKIKVAVICGGPSSEREVSLKSGLEVAKAIDRTKFELGVFEIGPKEQWFELEINNHQFNRLREINQPRELLKKYDVAFIAMHGKYGEDGQLQAFLQDIGLPYTGSAVEASTLAMDKHKTDMKVSQVGIKLPKTLFLSDPDQDRSKMIAEILAKIGLPCVIKPNSSGSSVGVTIVRTKDQIEPAFKKAMKDDWALLAQAYVAGRELTCGVMGNTGSETISLPVVEIITHTDFFDYDAKYSSDKTEEICPADLPEDVVAEVQAQAVKSHQVLGCRGVSRSDFILSDHGLYFLEINTIPGLTQTSLCPKEAKAAGMSFGQFIEKQIELALE